MQGELVSARLHMEQGFALYDREKHRHHALSMVVMILQYAAPFIQLKCCGCFGYPDQALQKSHDSVELARELYSLGHDVFCFGLCRLVPPVPR